MENKTFPSQEEVKNICKYCYLLFTKYTNAHTDNEFNQLVAEAKEIRDRYPYKLCEVMLIEKINIIDRYYREWKKKEDNNV